MTFLVGITRYLRFLLPLAGTTFWLVAPTMPAQDFSPERKEQRGTDAWLYVDRFEARAEILIPLRSLESILPVAGADDRWLEVEEQRAAAEDIAVFLQLRCPLAIDGVEVAPEDSRVVFLDDVAAAVSGAQQEARLATDRALVGLIFTYATKGAPHSVVWSWNAFNPVIETVRGTIYGPVETMRMVLTPDSPRLEWTDSAWNKTGAVGKEGPAIASVAAESSSAGSWWGWGGASTPKLDEAEARRIFEALLRNIYRAFDYREESAIYDALDHSVSGEFLAEIYLAVQRGLAYAAEGGATARVREVKILSGRLAPENSTMSTGDEACVYRADWTVRGRVEHWGHVHERTNFHSADFSLEIRDDAWKITGMKILKQERLDAAVAPRDSLDQGDAVNQVEAGNPAIPSGLDESVKANGATP